MSTKRLPENHTENEGAIELPENIAPETAGIIAMQSQDVRDLLIERTRLINQVRRFDPVEDVNAIERMSDARVLRMKLVKNRNAVDKAFKAAGDNARRTVDAINSIRKPLWLESESAEEFLEESEKFAERAEQLRIAELVAARTAQIASYSDPSFYKLGEMTEDVFQTTLAAARTAHEQRLQAEREAEAKRVAEEKARQEEAQRLRAENERLQRELVEAEKRRAAEAAAAEQRRLNAELEAQQRKLQKAQEDAAAAQREKERVEEQAEAQRQAAEAMERRKKEEAEAEAQRVREAAEAAPDREKIKTFVTSAQELFTKAPELRSKTLDRKFAAVCSNINAALNGLLDL